MNSMRKVFGLFAAVFLAAFALPAVADGGDYYRVNMPTAPVASGQQFSMTITNRAGFDFLKSFTITAPSGVSITAVASGSSNIPANRISSSGGTISVSNIAILNNQSGTLKITATFPASCTAQSLPWTSSAKGGFIVNNEVFTLDAGNSNLITNIAAGRCNYTFVTDKPAVIAGASTSMTATVANTAPSTGPALTGFVLTAPAGLNITGATGSSGTVTFTSTVITVTGISVTGGSSYPVNVTVAPAANCTGTPAAPWSSSVTPATFTLSGGNPTTSITAQACTMSISSPSSAAVGTVFPVTVNLTGGPGNAQVTLTPTGCPAPVSAPLLANAVSGVATFNLTFTGAGTCSLAATATNYTPTNNPRTFTVYAIPAIGCTNLVTSPGNDGSVDPNLPSVANPNGSAGQWGLRRGNNSDGSGCNPANATFTLDTTNNVSTLTYDKAAGGATGVFKYTIVWPEVAVDQSGPTTSWTDFRPKVSWGIDNPDPTTNDYVPAVTCADDDLSQGELLLPTIPNVAPFNALSPTTYPQYQPGQLARMCVAQQAWTSNGRADDGKIYVIYWDKVVDEGDGHVIGP